MKNKNRLFAEGLELYPLSAILIENLVLSSWVALGTLLIAQTSLAIGGVYLGTALMMILGVMRKLLCTHCYYFGKRCHVGWGKLSGFIFAKGDLEAFSTCAGQKIVPVFFGLLALIPMVFGLVSLIKDVMISKLILLLLLLVSILYSSIVLRKKSCTSCEMKPVCPGSCIK